MRFKWESDSPSTELTVFRQLTPDGLMSGLASQWMNPFVIIDSEVHRLWKETLVNLLDSACGVFTLSALEEEKSPGTLEALWETMAESGVKRDTCAVVIGGGLTCDVGALAASTFQRGLSLLLIPTTLLCMVDACLGGKTGINLRGLKNQVGSFHPADEILLFPEFLSTLPKREFRSGLAEALKTALIGDPSACSLIREISADSGLLDTAAELAVRCLAVKAGIVGEDLRESGTRMILNLGHTVGHALESIGSFALSHGEAVGLGLAAEASMAGELGGDRNLAREIQDMLEEIGLPFTIPEIPVLQDMADVLDHDKKSRRAARRWALPFGWGDCRIVELTPEQESSILPSALASLKA